MKPFSTTCIALSLVAFGISIFQIPQIFSSIESVGQLFKGLDPVGNPIIYEEFTLVRNRIKVFTISLLLALFMNQLVILIYVLSPKQRTKAA